jgi:hypothetical protein
MVSEQLQTVVFSLAINYDKIAMNNMKKRNLSLCLLISLSYCFILPSTTVADTTSNDNYSIDVENIDTNPQQPILHKHPPKKRQNDVTAKNNAVQKMDETISLTISQTTINYGILTPTNPSLRIVEISIGKTISGIQVFTYEDHPLTWTTQDTEKTTIPDTSCDNGSCSQSIAAPWDRTTTYGFGYRCDSSESNICDKQFNESKDYRRYLSESGQEAMVSLLITQTNEKKVKATITNKINISATQTTGNYNNTITYLAIPNF